MDKNSYRTGVANDIQNVIKRNSQPIEWKFLHKYCQSQHKNINILDVGCGTGNKMLYLHQEGYTNIIGIDYEPKAFKKMLIKHPELNIKQGNAENLSQFRDKQFNLAYCNQVLEHLPNPKLAIKEAYRVLKKNGAYVIGIPNGDHLNDKIIRLIQKIYYKKYDHLQRFKLNDIKSILIKNKFSLKKITKSNGSLDFLLDNRIPNRFVKSIIKIIYPLIKKIYFKTISYEILAIKK